MNKKITDHKCPGRGPLVVDGRLRPRPVYPPNCCSDCGEKLPDSEVEALFAFLTKKPMKERFIPEPNWLKRASTEKRMPLGYGKALRFNKDDE